MATAINQEKTHGWGSMMSDGRSLETRSEWRHDAQSDFDAQRVYVTAQKMEEQRS